MPGTDGVPTPHLGTTHPVLASLGEHLARHQFDRASLLATVVEHLSLGLGDAAAIFLLDEDRRCFELAALHHPDPAAAATIEQMFRALPHPTDSGLLGAVLASSEPLVIRHLTPTLLDALYAETPYRDFYANFPIHGIVIVPLEARGVDLGAIAVIRTETDLAYDEADVAFLVDLGERAAMGLHNIDLFEAEQASAELLRAVIETATDAIFVVDAEGKFLLANRATERIFGHPVADLIGQDLSLILPGHAAEPAGPSEHDGRRRDGSRVPVELSLTAVDVRDRTLYTGVLQDISGRKRAEARLAVLAHTDPLTGLANRARFRQHLDRATRTTAPFSVLFVDLDNFKTINDEWGHDTGDRVLTNVAQRLAGCIRAGDLLARWGGDEFTILAASNDPDEATALADRIVTSFTQPVTAYGHRFRVSASIGVARFPDDDRSPNRLVHCADEAMYGAKNDRPGTWRRYEGAGAHRRGPLPRPEPAADRPADRI